MPVTIALGGRHFEVRPLRLGQLRHLLDALEDMTGKTGGALIEAAVKVVAAGLAPSHPDVTPDAVLDLEAGLDELNAAVAAILRVAGLHAQEPQSGEAQPVAGPSAVHESSLVSSTPPSPPAVAMPIAISTA